MPNYNQILDEKADLSKEATGFVEKRFFVHILHLGLQMLLSIVVGGLSFFIVGNEVPKEGAAVIFVILIELFFCFLVVILLSIGMMFPMYKKVIEGVTKSEFLSGTYALGIAFLNIFLLAPMIDDELGMIPAFGLEEYNRFMVRQIFTLLYCLVVSCACELFMGVELLYARIKNW